MEQMYKIEITAVGEVRDKDGNLLSAEPITSEIVVSESQLRELQEASQQ